MTATLDRPASRGQLTKLAVVFAAAGYPTSKEGRARRLAFASSAVGRELTSSAELTRAECGRLIELVEGLGAARLCGPGEPTAADAVAVATFAAELTAAAAPTPELIGIRRGPYGCGPDGLHWVAPAIDVATHCRCGTVAQVPPGDRYCAPLRCNCGECPSWEPVPAPDFARAVTELREKEQRSRRWR